LTKNTESNKSLEAVLLKKYREAARLDEIGSGSSEILQPARVRLTMSDTKFAVTRSMNIRSVVAGGETQASQSAAFEPKVIVASASKKNSYLVRKNSFKTYMTQNIPSLMRNYSLL
jgi:hypothetical protein